MIYTCPKCGKKMDLSTQVLINSDYRVICPQCLCQLQIVGDYAYIPQDSLDLDTTIQPSHSINCPKCGHEASSNAHFCPNCGTSFDTQATATTGASGAIEDATVLPPPIPDSDPLYHEALQFLMSCTAITPMMLRDRFHISDERAAELIRQLEAGGAIGPYNNGGPRQILIPHRHLYDPPRQQFQGQGDGQDRVPPIGQPRRMSCLTIVLLVMLFMFLLKACGG